MFSSTMFCVFQLCVMPVKCHRCQKHLIHLCVLAHSSSRGPPLSSECILGNETSSICPAEIDLQVTGRRAEVRGDEEAQNGEMRRALGASIERNYNIRLVGN